MNIKNALGFFVLGLVMHAGPAGAQLLSANAVLATSSVRQMWLDFMSSVVGGIGFSYLAREGILRMQTIVTAIASSRLLRPAGMAAGQVQTTVRVGATY